MKLGIAGGGTIVREFLTDICPVPGVAVTALFARRSEVREALSTAHAIGDTFGTYEEFLASDKFDTAYIALPNHLHFSFAREALFAGKHVILEKPFTVTLAEAEELFTIAEEKGLFLFEAISNLYHPNLLRWKEALPSIGEIQSVHVDFSRRSGRYDEFLSGKLPPAFDPQKAGGAQMDLGVYNLHLILALFGAPCSAVYTPLRIQGVDLAGETVLTYPTFTAHSVCAKDETRHDGIRIEGTKGSLSSPDLPNDLFHIFIRRDAGESEGYFEPAHRMTYEWQVIPKAIDRKDTAAMARAKEATLAVMHIISKE